MISRSALLSFSLALGLGGGWLSSRPESRQTFWTASADFRSPLVPSVYSHKEIDALVSSTDFQSAVGSQLAAVPPMAGGVGFCLVARDADEADALSALGGAEPLLARKLVDITTTDLRVSRSHIEQAAREVVEKTSQREASRPTQAPSMSKLPVEDEERILRLRTEIAQLEAFVKGGPAPVWFEDEGDRDLLARAQERLAAEQAEKARLAAIFQPDSRQMVAQGRTVEEAKNSVLSLRSHLTKAKLAVRASELAALEKKAESLIEDNRQSLERQRQVEAEAIAQSAQVRPTEPAWMQKQSEELSTQEEKLAQRARLQRVGEPVVALRRPLGYWGGLGLWVLSIAGLLAALSLPARKRRPRALAASTSPLVGSAVSLRMAEPETNVSDLIGRLARETGRAPRAFLVLGYPGDAERSAFSLSLAKALEKESGEVRLLDFDFRGRDLTQRISDTGSLGVSDLLMERGPVEEFFASVPGTRIQFAPAGLRSVDAKSICLVTLGALWDSSRSAVVVDADFALPTELMSTTIDAVLCLVRSGRRLGGNEGRLVEVLRQSGLPVWGLEVGSSEMYPLG